MESENEKEVKVGIELFPAESELIEERKNAVIEACDNILKGVVVIKTSAQGMGKEYGLRAELEKCRQENSSMKKKLKKYELLLPMYKLEIKSLKNELEREKRKMILIQETPTAPVSSPKRKAIREKMGLKIEQRRRRRSRSFVLKSPSMMSPLSPTGTNSPSLFPSPGKKGGE